MAIPDEFTNPSGDAPLALITGAARRIGAAFVRALADDGFRVAIHCHQSRAKAEALAEELRANGRAAPLVVVADLADPDVAQTIFAQLPAVPRILINNASLFEEDGIDSINPALFEQMMAINLRAPVLLTEALARAHLPGTSALVVNLLDAKLAAPNPDYFSYTLSKFGLAGATELAARAFAPRKIRVNAIAPAVTLISGQQSKAQFEVAHVMNPLHRGVEMADLVRALRFLVQTPSITGQTLAVESGQRFLALPRDVAYIATL